MLKSCCKPLILSSCLALCGLFTFTYGSVTGSLYPCYRKPKFTYPGDILQNLNIRSSFFDGNSVSFCVIGIAIAIDLALRALLNLFKKKKFLHQTVSVFYK